MFVLFDKISSKLLYLIEVNGSLRDLNGLPFTNLGNGVLKDINGRTYYVDKNKLVNYFIDSTIAYSLRDLGLGTTNLIRVRRDSDNQERDFNGIEINNNTLLNWVTEESLNGNGYVKIWYDQSNNNNSIQNLNNLQPKIVDNGLLVTENEKPAIIFNGDNILSTTLTNDNVSESVCIVASDFNSGSIFSLNKTSAIDKLILFTTPFSTERTRYDGSNPLLESYRDEIQNTYTLIINSTSFNYYKNNSIVDSSTESFIPTLNKEFNIGSRYTNNLQLIGKIQEIIYFSSDITEIATEIFNNQKKYYNNLFDYQKRLILTPDGSGGDINKGFTITGIQIDYDESTPNNIVVWCSNDGRDIEPPIGDISINLASLIKLSINPNAPNLSVATKLDELIVSNDSNFGVGISIQGITINNDNNLAFLGADNNIYIYTKEGTYVNKFQAVSNSNGIAFDFENNYYLIYVTDGLIRRYNTSYEFVDEFILTNGDNGDQITYFENKLYISKGANGSPGTYLVYDKNFIEISKENNLIFDEILSTEGIAFYDKLLLFASDGYFHQTTPFDYNCIGIYRIK